MGMTIDEALKIIKDGRIVATAIRGNNEDDTKFNTDNIEALHVIEDTMRKYQRIKEQVEIAIDKENFAISGARLIQIREIIDRNDTTNTGSN